MLHIEGNSIPTVGLTSCEQFRVHYEGPRHRCILGDHFQIQVRFFKFRFWTL